MDTSIKKVSKTKPMFNTICEEAVQRRKLARQEWLIDTNNEVTLRRFKTRQKEASKILRCEKRKYVQNILEIAELDYKTHRTRDMYKRVNDLRGGYKKKERFLRDNDGSLITTSGELAKKRARYFEKSLNCEKPNETFNFNQETQESQDCEEPTLEEIKLQINMLKNNKSPGEDDIQSELLKEGGEKMVMWLWKVIHKVWTTEQMPKEWKTAVICPIHKKGSKQDCNNYCGIALLNVAYKIFSNCLLTRIKTKAEQIIGNYQGGFRPVRSTTDQIFILRQIFKKIWEFDREIHVLFIDFMIAFIEKA